MDNTTVDSQAEDTNQSQADETQTDQTNTEAKEPSQDAQTISLKEAKELRSEAKNLRTRLREAEGKLSNYETEKLTETQKLQKQFEDATGTLGKRESGLKTLILKNEVAALKDTVGLRAVNSIVRLIDTDALEYDLDGLKAGGVLEELKRLKKEDPGLFITGGTDGGAGGGGREAATEDMNDILRRKLKR